MQQPLTETEVRVLAALVEKAITTPEYYPLTLNALVNACNQKSNRDPVVNYDSYTVAEALDSLRERGLIRVLSGDRAPKYRHYFEEAYGLTAAETAVLCELMLRGPQTVGELRTRAERFNITLDLAETEFTLDALAARDDGPLVMKLPRQPGRKEPRFAHLLAGTPEITEEDNATPSVRAISPQGERLQQLEAEVQRLRDDLQQLREEFDAFTQRS